MQKRPYFLASVAAGKTYSIYLTSLVTTVITKISCPLSCEAQCSYESVVQRYVDEIWGQIYNHPPVPHNLNLWNVTTPNSENRTRYDSLIATSDLATAQSIFLISGPAMSWCNYPSSGSVLLQSTAKLFEHLRLIRVKKLIPNIVLWNKYLSNHDL